MDERADLQAKAEGGQGVRQHPGCSPLHDSRHQGELLLRGHHAATLHLLGVQGGGRGLEPPCDTRLGADIPRGRRGWLLLLLGFLL
jgi:hypothetical protein